MTTTHWLILATTLSAGLVALPATAADQPGAVPANTNNPSSPLVISPPSTPEQPVKKKKSTTAKKPATASKKAAQPSEPLKATPIVPGPAVVTQKSINMRGQ